MDPVTIGVTAGTAGGGYALRIVYRWLASRAETRRVELTQQGLSERARSLPPGSRLIEKTPEREVEISIGGSPVLGGRQEG